MSTQDPSYRIPVKTRVTFHYSIAIVYEKQYHFTLSIIIWKYSHILKTTFTVIFSKKQLNFFSSYYPMC